MIASRGSIHAALGSVGGHNYETLAKRYQLGPHDPDPIGVVHKWGFGFERVTQAPRHYRCEVRAHLIRALWHPCDAGLNVIFGLSESVFLMEHICATKSDVCWLAAYFVFSEQDRFDGAPSSHVPLWFVQMVRQARPGLARTQGSGVYPAISRVGLG